MRQISKALLLLSLFILPLTPSHAQSLTQSPAASPPFIPAKEVLFEDDLKDAIPGTIPPQWTLANTHDRYGKLATVKDFNGQKALVIISGNGVDFEPVMPIAAYLPDTFTVELDYCQDQKTCSTGCGGGIRLTGESRLSTKNLHLAIWGLGTVNGYCSYPDKSLGNNVSNFFKDNIVDKYNPGIWHHMSLSYSSGKILFYIDNKPAFATDACFPPKRLVLNGRAIFGIKNVRLAAPHTPAWKVAQKEADLPVHNILFDINKSTINPENQSFLTQLATWLQKHPTQKLSIHGHTDNEGSPASNYTLSVDRANAIKKALTAAGIQDNRLTIQGFGANKPADKTNTSQGKGRNRRVELTLSN